MMVRKQILSYVSVLLAISMLACQPSFEALTARIASAVQTTVSQQPGPQVPTPFPTVIVAPTLIPTGAPAPIAPPPPSPPVSGRVCSGGNEVVALIVDPVLIDGIRVGLDQFEEDLCSEGYAVLEHVSQFANPVELRQYLAQLRATTEPNLVGTILIGDLPHAYQWVTMTYANPEIPPLSEEVISFQYYADLDGTFAASPGYVSPAGHPYSYDVHTGNTDWEIWVGALPPYKGSLDRTIEAMNRYFGRNHAYRAGSQQPPRGFLQITEHHAASTPEQHEQIMQGLKTGQYAWTPFSSAPGAHIYFNGPAQGLSAAQGYANLSAGVADFTVADAHGTWAGHGQIDIGWAESNPVNTVFFWSNGCAVGNLDHPDNFLTSVLYSPTSMVLVAKGTTNDSGGMGTNQNGFFGHNIAQALSVNQSFGNAILGHVNVPLIAPWSESRELHFAPTVVLGDPTVRLRH